MADDKLKDETGVERITVLAKEFTAAAMEYHRREMGKQGYALAAPITAHRFYMIEGPGAPKELFDGEQYFVATFVRNKPES